MAVKTFQEKAKAAFTAQGALLTETKVIDVSKKDSKPETQQVSVLKQRYYYDLQAYLFTALSTIPSDGNRFDALYPKKDLEKLNELDANIYDETKQSLVDIWQHCHDFDSTTMPKFLTLAGDIISLCDQSIRDIDARRTGLLDQCAILGAEDSDPTAPAYQKAYKIATLMIGRLAEVAQQKSVACSSLQAEMHTFATTTATDKTNVDYLHGQYYGPKVLVNKNGSPKTDAKGKPAEPYAMALSAEIQRLQNEVVDLTNDAKNEMAEYDHDLVVATTTVTYAWLFPAGTIAAAATFGVYTARAVEAKAKYDEDIGKIAQDNKTIIILQSVFDMTKNMNRMIDGVTSTIQAALDALGAVQLLLANQAKDFTELKADMVLAQKDIGDQDQVARSLAVDDIQAAVDQYNKIKSAMQEFMISSVNVYSNAPTSVTKG